MAFRKQKLEEQIRRIVSELLIKEIKDPRIGFTTVTGVELSKDLSLAKIGVSVLGNPRDIRKTVEGLNSAVGFIQAHVGKGLGIRKTPHIKFVLDSSVAEGVDMVNLIDSVSRDSDVSDSEDASKDKE